MPPDFSVAFCGKGSLLLGPAFRQSAVGCTSPRALSAYLWLAQQANHQPFTKALGDRTITVGRGEWFGTIHYLCEQLQMSKVTLRIVLKELEIVEAITVTAIERRRSKRRPDGSETHPSDGSETDPVWVRNSPIARCLGTLVKVHGWKEMAASRGNGSETDPQIGVQATVRAPFLTAAQRRVNARALALTQGGGL